MHQPINWTVNNFARPDKRNLVIYEMLLRDFIEAHDWKTLKDTLNYFQTMGVNAIQLMPLNEFDGNESWGYNPSYFLAPDKYYGPKNRRKGIHRQLSQPWYCRDHGYCPQSYDRG